MDVQCLPGFTQCRAEPIKTITGLENHRMTSGVNTVKSYSDIWVSVKRYWTNCRKLDLSLIEPREKTKRTKTQSRANKKCEMVNRLQLYRAFGVLSSTHSILHYSSHSHTHSHSAFYNSYIRHPQGRFGVQSLDRGHFRHADWRSWELDHWPSD